MSGKGKHLTPEVVMAALGEVQDPELHKDLVSLGMIKDLSVQDGNVSFTIELTTPACPLRNQIEEEAHKAVRALEGVDQVEVRMSSAVPSDPRVSTKTRHKIRNVLAIASGKGGVGKTTLAVNIAAALAHSGARVGLLDADIYGPNVPTMIGADHMPPSREGKMIPAEAYGVRVMSIGFLVKPGQPIIWRGPMLHGAIRQFINDVEWGELDYLIVDLPPGTGDAQLSLAQSIPISGGVIVTLPQNISLEDARRGIELFRALDIPVLGIVENMSYLDLPDGNQLDVFGQGGGERLARETDVPFLGAVPLDPMMRETGDTGIPIVLAHPETKVARSLQEITNKLASKISMQVRGKSDSIPLEMID